MFNFPNQTTKMSVTLSLLESNINKVRKISSKHKCTITEAYEVLINHALEEYEKEYGPVEEQQPKKIFSAKRDLYKPGDELRTKKSEQKCPHCNYTCQKELGMKQHVTHFHPETKTKTKKIEKIVENLERTEEAIRIEKADSPLNLDTTASVIPTASTVTSTKLDFNYPSQEIVLKSTIIDCANPACFRLRRFVQGAGKMLAGKEFCTGRCILDFKENNEFPSQFPIY